MAYFALTLDVMDPITIEGFRSGWGAKVYADLCSIVATGRLHGRSPLAAIRAALATPETAPA